MVGSEVLTRFCMFLSLSCGSLQSGRSEYRRVRVPPNRLTPLRQQWENIMQPIVEHLKLQIRYNAKNKCIGAWWCPKSV
jgi:RNA-binding protein PNO1